jgi:hypothetical protein
MVLLPANCNVFLTVSSFKQKEDFWLGPVTCDLEKDSVYPVICFQNSYALATGSQKLCIILLAPEPDLVFLFLDFFLNLL